MFKEILSAYQAEIKDKKVRAEISCNMKKFGCVVARVKWWDESHIVKYSLKILQQQQ